MQDGLMLLEIAAERGTIIDKTRYVIGDSNGAWEIDIFHGKLKGLVMAEREFENGRDTDDFERPTWLGKEVTEVKKYTNASLFKNGL